MRDRYPLLDQRRPELYADLVRRVDDLGSGS
jgi:hypothetical protein